MAHPSHVRARTVKLRFAWLFAAVGASACTSMVTPPSAVADPAVVYVIKEALHTGLVLPPTEGASGSPGSYVEFGFGDWGFYALGDNGACGAITAVLWPTRGALGRRRFAARTDSELRLRAAMTTLTPVVVSAARASALRHRLQRAFDGARKEVVVDRDTGVKFVPSATRYWWPHTCADAVADWLEELGCDVAWAPARLGLYVARPDS